MPAYDVCNGSTGSGTSSTFTVTVGTGAQGVPQGSNAGDLVWVTARGTSNLPTACSDSQGNPYSLVVSNGANSNTVAVFASLTTKALIAGGATPDTITVTYTTTTGVKSLIARGCPGVASATADKTNNNAAGAGSPSSGSTGILSLPAELVVGAVANSSGGGAPTAPSFGTAETVVQTSYLTEFDEITATTAAVTASATTTSTAWAALVASFPMLPVYGRSGSPTGLLGRLTPRKRRGGTRGVSGGAPVIIPAPFPQPPVVTGTAWKRRGGITGTSGGAPPVLAYLIGTATAASGSSSLAIPVTNAPGAGDGLIVIGGSGGPTITGATDSGGNPYNLPGNAAVPVTPEIGVLDSLSPSVQLAVGGSLTVDYSGSSGAKNGVAVGVPGASAVDSSAVNGTFGTSGTPAVTSGALAQPSEILIGAVTYGQSGGASITWADGWLPLAAPFRTGTFEWTAVAYYPGDGAAPVTLSATVAGTPSWTAVIFPLMIGPVPAVFTAPGGPVGFLARQARRLRHGQVRGASSPAMPVTPASFTQPGPVTGKTRKRRGAVQGSPGAPVTPPVPAPFPQPGKPTRQPAIRKRAAAVHGSPGAPVIKPAPFILPGKPTAPKPRRRPGTVHGSPVAPAIIPAATRLLGRPVAMLKARKRPGKVTGTSGGSPLVMTPVNVVGSWTASRAITTGSFVPGGPVTESLDCDVAPADGNWLIAFAAQTLLPGYQGSTLGVSNDVHGVWIPLGAPGGTSDASALTRCSIWVRPGGSPENPVPGGSHVYVSPQGMPGPVYPAVIGVTVIELTGMSPYAGIPAVATSAAAAANTITADPGTPTTQALAIGVAATDNGTLSPPAGWSTLPGINVSDGAPAVLYTAPVWQVTTLDAAATWTVPSGAGDLSCCVALILLTNPAPSQPNPNWPATQLQFGFGSGASTPQDQIAWTDMTSRLMGSSDTSTTRGIPYEYSQTQAGTMTLTLANNDGYLDPENSASPYFPLMIVDTPVRLLMTWQGRTYSFFSGYVSRLPQSWTSATRYGVATIKLADSWSLLTNQLDACQQEEIQARLPYAYWPCNDAAGSSGAQNAAPGNPNQLIIAQGKGGGGGATAVFGGNNGVNPGDPDSTTFTQTGLGANNAGHGYCLTCQDVGLPALEPGITIMGWLDPVNPATAPQPTGLNLYLMKGSNSSTGDAFALFLGFRSGYSTGGLYLRTYDRVTRQPTDHVINNTFDWLAGGNTHFTVLLTQATWQVMIDAGAFTGASGTCNLPQSLQWLSFLGSADRFYTGSFLNAGAGHIAVFPALLPQDAINQILIAGYPQSIGGQFPETPNLRIERLAGYGGWAGARAISTASQTLMAPISDIQGQSGNISASGHVTQAGGQTTAQAATNIVTSDNGWCYADGNGVLCYLSRGDLYNQPPMWHLGELTEQGEFPYQPGVTIGNDKSRLYNTAELTPSTGSGTPVNAQNAASVQQHSAAVYTGTAYQAQVAAIVDQANWIVNTRSTPQNHAESVEVDAGANPANWPFVLGVEPAHPVQAARRPITASQPVILQAVVCQVTKTLNYAAGKASARVVTDSFPEGAVLSVGDPVYGQLNGANNLPW